MKEVFELLAVCGMFLAVIAIYLFSVWWRYIKKPRSTSEGECNCREPLMATNDDVCKRCRRKEKPLISEERAAGQELPKEKGAVRGSGTPDLVYFLVVSASLAKVLELKCDTCRKPLHICSGQEDKQRHATRCGAYWLAQPIPTTQTGSQRENQVKQTASRTTGSPRRKPLSEGERVRF